MAAVVASGGGRDLGDQLRNPVRGSISLAMIDADADQDVLLGAEDFLLSFGIAAAIAGDFAAVNTAVEAGLGAPELSALHPLMKRMLGQDKELRSEREGAAITVGALRQDLTARPGEFYWAGVWMLLHLRTSNFRASIADPVAHWIISGWTHLIREARFRLAMPTVNVPPIEAILLHSDRTVAAAARLLLVAAPAASTALRASIRTCLEELTAAE